jgi:hypothetical protein
MMRSKGAAGVIFLCLSYLLFLFGAKNFSVPRTEDMPGSVVLPPALQSVLYLGDPYLAANVEATRVLMTGGTGRRDCARLLRQIASGGGDTQPLP